MSRDAGEGSKPAYEHVKLVHSMAGAAVLIYVTDCLVKGEAHGISQIIAAGPAGFQRPKGQSLPHPQSPLCFHAIMLPALPTEQGLLQHHDTLLTESVSISTARTDIGLHLLCKGRVACMLG